METGKYFDSFISLEAKTGAPQKYHRKMRAGPLFLWAIGCFPLLLLVSGVFATSPLFLSRSYFKRGKVYSARRPVACAVAYSLRLKNFAPLCGAMFRSPSRGTQRLIDGFGHKFLYARLSPFLSDWSSNRLG